MSVAGAYFLQEAFFKTHHPTLDELECAKRYVSDVLRPLKNSKFMPDLLIYGSSNIIDFLQAMKVLLVENNSREHPYKVHIDTLHALYEKLIGMCYEDRMPLYQAESYYMWSAEKALLNVFQICENLGISTVIPSNNNISSGILYDLAYGSKK